MPPLFLKVIVAVALHLLLGCHFNHPLSPGVPIAAKGDDGFIGRGEKF
jgi:hypothetical protein